MLTKSDIETKIKKGRDMIRFDYDDANDDYKSDQDLKLPQPPLVKADMSDESIPLPTDFSSLDTTVDFTELLINRKSSRVYTEENISLLELSYILWSIQGIKDIRGKKYATIRTVPSGGARHPFETYMIIKHVEGLKPGKYHYLPWGHRIEYLGEIEDIDKIIDKTIAGQTWAVKSSVVFYFSAVFYRSEWRYGINAHRPMLFDMGHVGENLYLSATLLHLGTCASAAFEGQLCNELFGLDGEEETMMYSQTLGTISKTDNTKEQAFYQFVEDEGL